MEDLLVSVVLKKYFIICKDQYYKFSLQISYYFIDEKNWYNICFINVNLFFFGVL